MAVTIALSIDCGERTCGECQFKTIFKTGLAGEFHPKCEVFDGHFGKWGELDMKRSRECVAAQKRATT